MKSIEEVKAKLQKLFAMVEAGSGASQQEIETAMTKARKLMYEYKLSEQDLKATEEKLEVISKELYNISFSAQKNPWISTLISIVADNYCCHACMYHRDGAKLRTAGMIGFKEDVELASKVLTYAVESILADNDKIRRQALRKGYTNKDATAMGNAYGNGYVRGIREAFEEQNRKEQEEATSFAVVMVQPQEVKDYVKQNCVSKTFNTSNATRAARNYDSYAVKGYCEGKKFNTASRLVG